MKTLVFATGNKNKVREVNQMLEGTYLIKDLKDIGCLVDIPETAPDLEGNAILKAKYVFENYGLNCFSEDTGLEIDALNGAPGVMTARYAGDSKDANANMAKAIGALEGKENRGAQFRTILALILDGKEYLFEGICRGTIRKEKSGTGGFGYDPIFEPEGYNQTFAELDKSVKNEISHRGRAIKKLIDFLKDLNP